jgi:retron-type reverse transcriptase
LKCDIRKFFASVDHDILFRLLKKKIQDERVLNLLAHVIASFHMEHGKGIPLGNLTSQLFANIYLHELDWYVKQTLGVQHYIRYCDDFVIVCASRSRAFHLAKQIDIFLKNQLQMELHPNKVSVKTWRQGIDFLGYVLLPQATVLRTKTAKRILRKVTPENLTSYLGVCEHANTFEFQKLIRTIIC